METIAILTAITAAALAAYLLAYVRRLEEVLIQQQNSLHEVDMYAQQVEDNTLHLLAAVQFLEDVLAEDYPELVEEPEPTYPLAYDDWGEFDA